MGDSLNLCSGAEAVRKFQKAGWTRALLKVNSEFLSDKEEF